MLYFDNAATTPLLEELSLLNEMFISKYHNPSSKYASGKEIKKEIDKVRNEIALFINTSPENIFFTSGATESNNTVIKGFYESYDSKKYHLITSAMEHPSILEPIKFLENKNRIEASYLEGYITKNSFYNAIKPHTQFCSIMCVNNETGILNPIQEIGKIVKEKDIYFHSDMTQAIGKIDVDVKELNLDAASFSGHKINGPKGIGFLYLKDSKQITPLLHGGGQEFNFRCGTENVLGILHLGLAIEKYRSDNKRIKEHYALCKRTFLNLLDATGIVYKLHFEENLDAILSISFKGIKNDLLMSVLDYKYNTMISIGSACNSNKEDKNLSHVLLGMGVGEEEIRQTVRISFGIKTELEDIYKFVNQLVEIFNIFKINDKIYEAIQWEESLIL